MSGFETESTKMFHSREAPSPLHEMMDAIRSIVKMRNDAGIAIDRGLCRLDELCASSCPVSEAREQARQ